MQMADTTDMTTHTATTVGRFTFDSADSTVSGPADYVSSDQYKALIRSIEGGTNHTFRAACEYSPDFVTALLVTIQTDYAGWHGMEVFNRSREMAAK